MPAKRRPKPHTRARCFLVDREGMVYMDRTESGFLLPLGGVVEEGEAPEETILRELVEEIGLEPDPARLRYLGQRGNIHYFFLPIPIPLRTGIYQASNDPHEKIHLVRIPIDKVVRIYSILRQKDSSKSTRPPLSRDEALKLARRVIRSIRPYVLWATPVGSLIRWSDDPQRRHEFVNDVDILVVPRPEANPKLLRRPGWERVNFFVTDLDRVEPALIHWSLGKAIIHLKRRAKSRGLKLTRYGLEVGPDVVIRDAEEIFRMLDYEPPKHLRRLIRKWRRRLTKLRERGDVKRKP